MTERRQVQPLRMRNLTPHTVRVLDGERVTAVWPPSGRFARVVEARRAGRALTTDIGEVPLVEVTYSPDVVDLPPEQPGVAYVVSRVLAAAVARDDLYFPADEVRDESGGIVGCRALARFTHAGSAGRA